MYSVLYNLYLIFLGLFLLVKITLPTNLIAEILDVMISLKSLTERETQMGFKNTPKLKMITQTSITVQRLASLFD